MLAFRHHNCHLFFNDCCKTPLRSIFNTLHFTAASLPDHLAGGLSTVSLPIVSTSDGLARVCFTLNKNKCEWTYPGHQTRSRFVKQTLSTSFLWTRLPQRSSVILTIPTILLYEQLFYFLDLSITPLNTLGTSTNINTTANSPNLHHKKTLVPDTPRASSGRVSYSEHTAFTLFSIWVIWMVTVTIDLWASKEYYYVGVFLL